ncbi:MAG TPA: Ig domain-containing protein [Pseudobacteroides sp.]|nr:Ig domain-containing protein [Pseudobacteroides sp.]
MTTTNSLILNPIGNKTVNEGQTLKFTLRATASEGKTITYIAANLPTGAKINSATGEFTWTPSVGQAGTYNIRFQASDGKDTVYEDVTITVVKNSPVPEDIT